jgi:hypothetical protein
VIGAILIRRAGSAAIICCMSDDQPFDRLEETLRAIANEISQSAHKLADGDLDAVAGMTGVQPEQVKRWVDGAGAWLNSQADKMSRPAAEPKPRQTTEDPLRGAGPHPLDVPTEEQGIALAALHSGRWTIEPGTSALASHGDGPAPRDALGLVRELRARDWIDADGSVTMVGRHALSRWLEAAEQR